MPSVELREYTIRLMGPNDEALMQALFESDPDYFRLVQGAPPDPAEAKDLLNELPEGKQYRDKFVYALFDRNGALAVVIDLIRGYPNDETWYLGLIFVAPVRRDMGLGTRVLEAVCTHVKRHGGHAVRLGVDRRNVRARALYERRGFRSINERERAHPNGFKSVIDVLERAL
jgi:ribosomal protein S18 acetylase RimI-like enzyme